MRRVALRMDGKRGPTGGPITRSGPSVACVDDCGGGCWCGSIGGNGDGDQSEPELELLIWKL